MPFAEFIAPRLTPHRAKRYTSALALVWRTRRHLGALAIACVSSTGEGQSGEGILYGS